MDVGTHIHLSHYARLDGIDMKWVCKITENLSLKIKEGILFIFIENKLLEAVNLLHVENVKIAVKDRMLAVAHIDHGFVTRFRVKFHNHIQQSIVNEVIAVIDSFIPMHRFPGSSVETEYQEQSKTNVPKLFEQGTIFREVSLDGLKKLTDFGENETQKDIISTLILDPKFLQYIFMLNRTLNKSSEKNVLKYRQ